MPGTIILKPIIANFDNDLSIELDKRVSPFCVAIIGDKQIKGSTCPKGGKHPFWKGTFYLPRHDEQHCFIEIRNHHMAHEIIGITEISVQDIVSEGKLAKWYTVYFRKKAAGQILIHAFFVDKEYAGHYVCHEKAEKDQKDLPEHILPADLVEDNYDDCVVEGRDEIDNPDFKHHITSKDFDLNDDVSIEALGESMPNLRTNYLVEEKLLDAEGLDTMNATTI